MDENLITPSDFFHRGLEHLESGKFREALEHFEEAIGREYVDNDIHLPMGEALFEIGRYQDALDHFNRVEVEEGPLQHEVLLWKGSCHLELRKPRRAISAFNRVLELHPDHAEAHFKRGLALADIGSPDRALESFLRAEKLLRGGEIEKEALAEVLMWKGRVLSRIGRRQEGLEMMFQAYEQAPEHPGPYNEIADSFRLSGDLNSAEEWYRKGLEKLPDDPSLHNDYGNLLRELGRNKDSLAHLTTAIEHDANRTVAYYNRALTLERMEMFDEALKDYDSVIEANTVDLDAKLRKLDLLAQMGLFKEAHELLFSLTELERKDASAQETASRLYNRQAARAEKAGDTALALRMHKMVLDLHADYLDVETPAPGDDRPEIRLERLLQLVKEVKSGDDNFGLAVLLRGAAEYGLVRLRRREHAQPGAKAQAAALKAARNVDALLKKAIELNAWPELCSKLLAELAFYEFEDDDQALAHIEEAIRRKPDFVGALWVKAVVLSDGKQMMDEAVACYRRILQITPGNPTILLSLGDLYFDQGHPHRALACFRRVLEERPGDLSVNREIGRCYLALGRYGDAISTFARMDAEGVMGLELKLDLAESHLAVGERVETQKLVEAVLAENHGLDPNVEGRAAEVSAALALARRNPKLALKELKKVQETQLSTFGLIQRIKAHIDLGKYADADEDIAEVLAMLDPHAGDALEAMYHAARVAFAQDRLDDALAMTDQLLSTSPLDERAWRLRAWVQKLKGDIDESDNTEMQRRFAGEIARVNRLLQYEDFQDALSLTEAMSRAFPDRVEPDYYKACALAQMGDEEAALAALAEVARRSPDLKARMLEEFYLEPLRLHDRPEYRPAAASTK